VRTSVHYFAPLQDENGVKNWFLLYTKLGEVKINLASYVLCSDLLSVVNTKTRFAAERSKT
jgi:hypothetical protein